MFDLEIYICFRCGYPVIFRYNPPQIFHLGSGWPCWSKKKKEEKEKKEKKKNTKSGTDKDTNSDKIATCAIPKTTPIDIRKKQHKTAKKQYGIFYRTGDAAPVLDFVMTQLENDRGDIVQDLFAYLAMQGNKAGNAMVCIIVSLLNWQEYIDYLRDQTRKALKEQIKKEKQRLVKEKGGR